MTDRAIVLGSPVAHSLSPVLHRAAYAALGLTWHYDAVECDQRSLPAVLDALGGSGRYAGASLTMPLKRAALTLVDDTDDVARAIGAVNTVVFGGERRTGHNTDVAGLVAALREVGVDRAPAAPVVLGGGGAARAAIGALAEIGAGTVTVFLRDVTRGAPLVEVGARVGVAVVVEPWSVGAAGLPAADVAIATVPAGATDALAALRWPPQTALVDVVYAPWPTALGEAAARAGAAVVGGLSMLVAQAAEQVTLMTGRPAPVDAMRAAGGAALAARHR